MMEKSPNFVHRGSEVAEASLGDVSVFRSQRLVVQGEGVTGEP